jgi:hypothetical protein
MSSKARTPFPWPLLRFWTRRTLLMWCLIAIMIFTIQLFYCGIVHNNERVKALLQYMDVLPSFMKTAFGGDMLQLGNITGLIAMGYNDPLVLLLYMLFAVGVPTGLLGGSVQKGTMELILSRRATKTQVYICAGLITITGMFALVLVMFSGTFVSTKIYPFEQTIQLYPFFIAAIVGGTLASAVGGISLLAAGCFRRNTAIWLTTIYLVMNYFAEIVGEWWTQMKWLKHVTIFDCVDETLIFTKSAWPVSGLCVLISILVVTTLFGGIIWSRRDLPM